MNDVKSGEKKRLYLYDNLKFLLIVLVVLGHLIDDSTVKLFGDGGGETGVPQAKVFSGAFLFLYAFHMPLFIFISGLFNRGHDDGRKVLGKTLGFVVIGMLMKCLNYWSQVRFQTDFDKENSDGEIFFDLLGGDGVYWYMFAMAAFMVICYLLRNRTSGWYTPVPDASGAGALNTMISMGRVVWGWSRRPTALMRDVGSAFLPMQCQ